MSKKQSTVKELELQEEYETADMLDREVAAGEMSDDMAEMKMRHFQEERRFQKVGKQ